MRINLLIAFCFGQAILNFLFIYLLGKMRKKILFIEDETVRTHNEVANCHLQIYKLKAKMYAKENSTYDRGEATSEVSS